MGKGIEGIFTDPVKVIEAEDIEQHESGFGNSYFGVTKEQIEELLTGKVLVNEDWGEYNTFLYLVETKPMNREEKKAKEKENGEIAARIKAAAEKKRLEERYCAEMVKERFKLQTPEN